MALKKCKECGEEISTEAGKCPKCGAPQTKRSTIGCLAAIIIIILIAIIGNNLPSSNPTATKTSENISTPKAADTPSSPWSYGSTTDEMSGKVSKHATTESTNIVNFDFPYQGEQRGTIMISNNAVLFYVKKGQVICHGGDEYGTCVVRVKFDDGKEKYVGARELGDDSTTIMFTEPSFIKKLKQSKKLMIQAEVYNEGLPVFTFNVGGFDHTLLRN
jgi:hypothetical protein